MTDDNSNISGSRGDDLDCIEGVGYTIAGMAIWPQGMQCWCW